ncbi:MAG: hypothetical protein H7175_07785, partial [Burkholderiales bacterium]|nr:hypothetical protein [Anaerolineae bacterium]
GYVTGGSYIYNVETHGFTLGWAPLASGAVVWSDEDELISLRWSNLGESYNQLISPLLSRLAPPYFIDTESNPGSQRFSLTGLIHNAKRGFLSPAGNYAAAVDSQGGGMIWNATNGEAIAMLSDAAQVIWSPDETRMVVQRLDGSIWLLTADGSIEERLPISASLQSPTGTFFWALDSSALAHIHDGIVDVWRLAS